MPEVSEDAVWKVVFGSREAGKEDVSGMHVQEGTANDARNQLDTLVSWNTMQQFTNMDRHHSTKTSALSILLEYFFNTTFIWPA